MERTAGEDGAVTPKQVNREGAVTVVTQTHMEGEELRSTSSRCPTSQTQRTFTVPAGRNL